MQYVDDIVEIPLAQISNNDDIIKQPQLINPLIILVRLTYKWYDNSEYALVSLMLKYRGRLNIMMSSYQYQDPLVKDKTVSILRQGPGYLDNYVLFTGHVDAHELIKSLCRLFYVRNYSSTIS